MEKRKDQHSDGKERCRVGAPSTGVDHSIQCCKSRKIPGGECGLRGAADLAALLAYVGTNCTPHSVPKRAKKAPGLQLAAARSRPHRSRILQANIEYSFHTTSFEIHKICAFL